MKRFFLIKNGGDIDIFLKHYLKTHAPFVLSINEFRHFDRHRLPFMTVGNILSPRQTRRFCKEYLDYLRKFIQEMDRLNRPAAEVLFNEKLNLFSAVGYNIFWCFYSVFLFVSALYAMRKEETCEIVMTAAQDYLSAPAVHWYKYDDYFRINDDMFSFLGDFFTDPEHLKIIRIVCPAEAPLCLSHAPKSYEIATPTVDKIVLNMDPTHLVGQVIPNQEESGVHGKVGYLSLLETIQWGSRKGLTSTGEHAIHIQKPTSDRCSFMPYFRCNDLLSEALIPVYERILGESVSSVGILDRLFRENKVLAVLDICPGDSYIHALVSELARKRGIPVIGMQHGGHYGYMDFFDKLGYCDYYFCDYWLSWGFDTGYLKKTFTSSGPPLPEIIPTGSVSIARMASKKKTVAKNDGARPRILYPMVNNVPFLQSTFRINDLKLFYFQKRILSKLIASDAEIVIKPQAGYPIALQDMFDNAPSTLSISFDPLSKVLSDGSFDWIIMDHLSTPFEEACVMGDQILVYNDSVLWPVEDHAKALIKKRAWFFEDEDPFLDMLESILSGDHFHKKTDTAFEAAFILPHGQDTLALTKNRLHQLIFNEDERMHSIMT